MKLFSAQAEDGSPCAVGQVDFVRATLVYTDRFVCTGYAVDALLFTVEFEYQPGTLGIPGVVPRSNDPRFSLVPLQADKNGGAKWGLRYLSHVTSSPDSLL